MQKPKIPNNKTKKHNLEHQANILNTIQNQNMQDT